MRAFNQRSKTGIPEPGMVTILRIALDQASAFAISTGSAPAARF